MTNVHVVIDIGRIRATKVRLESFELVPAFVHLPDRIG